MMHTFLEREMLLDCLVYQTLKRCIVTLWMLAYGMVVHKADEYCSLGESTTMEATKQFVLIIQVCYETTYLKQLTRVDILKHMQMNEVKGFPSVFTFIDYMHYEWTHCPIV
jgi:hypothetical protein